eukprot:SAG31_NODE_1418_length_8439_cov_20.075540_3_plen_203_part_00
MTWTNLSDEENGMVEVMIIMLIEWPLFLLAAQYFDQVLDSGTSVRRPWNYCCTAHIKRNQTDASPCVDSTTGGHTLGSSTQVIEAVGLQKLWPGRAGQPPKLAVDDVSLTVGKKECFGLLGQNGAGKTTTIMMLCGLLEPSDGAAHIAGYNIKTQMLQIYQRMGVCPQHNLLWETLTALEHVVFCEFQIPSSFACHITNFLT